MWAVIQQQQAEIEALRGELAAARAGMEATDEKVAEADAKIEATGDVIETMAVADAAHAAGVVVPGVGLGAVIAAIGPLDNDLDDDGNGHVDDTWGWDFCADTAPVIDSHGTQVAGQVAGAELHGGQARD